MLPLHHTDALTLRTTPQRHPIVKTNIVKERQPFGRVLGWCQAVYFLIIFRYRYDAARNDVRIVTRA